MMTDAMQITEIMKKNSINRNERQRYRIAIRQEAENRRSSPAGTPNEGIVDNIDPIESLISEHDQRFHHLALMVNGAKSIQDNGFSAVAFQMIADAIRCIGGEIRQHHEKEERFLFPLIEKHFAGLSLDMRHEHRALWHVYSDLITAVQHFEEGSIHGLSIHEVVKMVNGAAILLRDHMEKENTVLFPMVKQVLTAEEYQQLGKGIMEANRV